MLHLLILLSLLATVFSQSLKPHRFGIVVTDMRKSIDWYKLNFNVDVYHKISFPSDDSLEVC